MISQRDVMHGLYGAYRLASWDKSGLAWLDTTSDGALRSFWALLVVVPAYLLLVLLNAPAETPVSVAQLGFQAIAYVVSWLAYLLVCHELAQWLGRGSHYPGFVCAYNWAGLLQIGLYLPMVALSQSGMLPPAVGEFLVFAAVVLTTAYQWFVTRTALAIPGMTAVGFVLMDMIVSLFVDYLQTVMQQIQ
jgi:hypothetical protein